MEYYVTIKMIIMQKHEKCLWSTGHWNKQNTKQSVCTMTKTPSMYMHLEDNMNQ